MKRILIILFAALCSVTALSAFSYQYNFLHTAPVNYFTDEDLKIYLAAAEDALNSHINGSKVTWRNPKTGAYGTIIPVSTTKKNGLICRQLNIFNHAASRNGRSFVLVCKYKSGWKIPGDTK